jgi:predicted nucleic acid-binding protein
MTIFIDTSAFLSVIDAEDCYHETVKSLWEKLVLSDQILITSNYVILESSALIQHRMGMKALESFIEDILPIIHIKWIDSTVHNMAVRSNLASGKRKISMVDWSSFIVMKNSGITDAFTLDDHFKQQGFKVIP